MTHSDSQSEEAVVEEVVEDEVDQLLHKQDGWINKRDPKSKTATPDDYIAVRFRPFSSSSGTRTDLAFGSAVVHPTAFSMERAENQALALSFLDQGRCELLGCHHIDANLGFVGTDLSKWLEYAAKLSRGHL